MNSSAVARFTLISRRPFTAAHFVAASGLPLAQALPQLDAAVSAGIINLAQEAPTPLS